MSHSEEGAADQVSETTSAADQTEGPAVGGKGEPGVSGESQGTENQGGESHGTESQDSEGQGVEGQGVVGEGAEDAQGEGGKGRVAAVAAGTGAAVAGIAGGIAVAARDTRRRVLGVPIGKRSRFQRGATAVVDKAQGPVRRIGSRFSRD